MVRGPGKMTKLNNGIKGGSEVRRTEWTSKAS